MSSDIIFEITSVYTVDEIPKTELLSVIKNSLNWKKKQRNTSLWKIIISTY